MNLSDNIFIDIHTHPVPGDRRVTGVINFLPQNKIPDGTYCSVGLHPWFIPQDENEDWIAELRRAVTRRNVVAVGECGLDRVRGPGMEKQLAVFRIQALMAGEFRKPLIIHCVRAFNEIISEKKSLRPEQPWIIHGFSANRNVADRLLKHGFFLSFGKAILDDRSHAARLIGELPPGVFFLESDESESGIIPVYEMAAMRRKMTLAELQKQMAFNFQKYFLQHD